MGRSGGNQENKEEKMNTDEHQVQRVWTDGACFPNPGRGGWAWTCLDGRQDFGGLDHTTNQVMELTAAVRAITDLWVPNKTLVVISDSQYVIKGATNWSKGWVQNGWRNSAGQPVANQPLWKNLLEVLAARPGVIFQWVKGHSGDPGNEEADRLATHGSGADKALIEKCASGWHGARP
jgi:ribonuclease HI